MRVRLTWPRFVPTVDNPYLPYRPGMSWRYTGVAEDGTTPQVDDVLVTNKTKRILGVACTVVLERSARAESLSSAPTTGMRRTTQGMVWYFGEDARDYKHGRFVKAPDSWEAGVDGAQPGSRFPVTPSRETPTVRSTTAGMRRTRRWSSRTHRH